MDSNIPLDSILLYSQCPMRYNFAEHLGITERTTTFTGQLEAAMESTLWTYISTVGHDRTASSHSMRVYNKLVGGISIPSDDRGSPRKRADYKERIEHARERVTFCFSHIKSMNISTCIGSPYMYELSIMDRTISGKFDAILQIGSEYHIVVFDLNKNYPSDEYLNNGIKGTISMNVFRKLFPDAINHKLVHFNIYNIAYLEVTRTLQQLSTSDYELQAIVSGINNTLGTGYWYRSKSQICNSCYAARPCDEIYRRINNLT